MQSLKQELQHLHLLCGLVIKPGQMFEDKGNVAKAEEARTVLAAKSAKLLRSMTALPLGVSILESVQDQLAEYHSQAALLAGLDIATLGLLGDGLKSELNLCQTCCLCALNQTVTN